MGEKETTTPIWLLLLPNPPSDVSLDSLRAAYGPGLTQVLKDGSSISSGSTDLILDIAVAYDSDSAFEYLTLQNLIALLYRLICVICTEHHIDTEYDNEVDTRFVFFQLSIDSIEHQSGQQDQNRLNQNSIIDLNDLAQLNRKWQRVCFPEGSSSEGFAQIFSKRRSAGSHPDTLDFQMMRLPGGLTLRQKPQEDLLPHGSPFLHHCSVAVGGTFDHLHAGHKLLLTMTALVLSPEPTATRCLTIGITGDELLEKKNYREELEDFFERQCAVQRFLLGILELISPAHVLKHTQKVPKTEPFGREVHDILRSGVMIKYVEIFDPYGPTVTDEAISALVLSAETRSGGQAVNDRRKEKGWPNLEVFEVGVLDSGDKETKQADNKFEGKISSTDIRRRLHQRSKKVDH